MRQLFATVVFTLVLAGPSGCKAQEPAPEVVTATPPAPPPPAPQPSPWWNERALFLAGLPVPPTSPLAAVEKTKEWADHQKALESDYGLLGGRRDKMGAWARAELDPRIDPKKPLVYFFGGPDVVTAVTMFPEAPSYFLAGLEPLGQVAPPESLTPKALDQALDGVVYALRTIVRASFFRTVEMGKDLSANAKVEIRGVLPLLLLFLAREGDQVLDVQRFELDAVTGVPTNKGDTEAFGPGIPGVRVRFQREGAAAPQSLTYVRIDLGNDALAKTPGFWKVLEPFVPGNGLLKAASFILHDNKFSAPRDFLLQNLDAVLQEDSGLPLRAFKKGDWEHTCFGRYARPRAPFQTHFQTDLSALCAAQPARPLPFIVGYRRADDSNLLLVVKKPGEPIAATATVATQPAASSSAPAAGATPPTSVPTAAAVQPAPGAAGGAAASQSTSGANGGPAASPPAPGAAAAPPSPGPAASAPPPSRP